MNAEIAESISPSQVQISRRGLHILYEILGLCTHSLESPGLSDAVIIAIDFENIFGIKTGFSHEVNCQVGLALLDTKHFRCSSPDTLISTFNFAAGSSSYITKATNKFLFGETVPINPFDLVNSIKSCIPKDRNIVLVGHGLRNELHAMEALGFQFQTSVPLGLDTLRLANEFYEIWAGSLGDLLSSLQCPYDKLHCAGNDANFTLRALLLLAAEGFTNQQSEIQDGNILDNLRQIAT
ncbi:hypothetical protein V8C42DRAFT_146179 [Trichoderma barbatum]